MRVASFLRRRAVSAMIRSRIAPAAALLTLAVGTASATDVELPTTGVDVSSYTGALVTNLGGVLGTAIAAGFALFAIWMGFKYVKSAIRGR